MFKNVIKITKDTKSLMPLRHHKIQEHLHKKVMRDVILNLNKKETYYINKLGIVTYNLPYVPKVIEPIIKYTSGIHQPPKNFYSDNVNIDLLAKSVHKYIHTIFGCVPLNTKDDLVLQLHQFLKKDPTLDNVSYYPLAQHIIVSTCALFKFPVKIFQTFGNDLIDYSEYEQDFISGMGAIEAIVISETLLNNPDLHPEKMQIIAQNPKNNPEVYSAASYEQGKQPFMDFRVKVETSANKIFFLDSKLIKDPIEMLSLVKGHISLTTTIDYSKLLNRFYSDILTSIRQKNASKMQQNIIKESAATLKNDCKNLTMEQQVILYHKMVRDLLLDPRVTAIIPSIIVVPRTNVTYNTYVMENMTEYFYTLAEIKKELLEKDTLNYLVPIPNVEQQVHLEFWHNFLLKIIKKYPEPTKSKLLENYHKFKLLEYDTDF